MTRTEIYKSLQSKGYEVEMKEIIKNGVIFEGILFKNNNAKNISPIIYTQPFIEKAQKDNLDIDEVVQLMLVLVKNSEKDSIDIDVKCLSDRDFILNHLLIGLQKESDEQLIKGECNLDGIESFLYIRLRADDAGCFGTVKVSYDLLSATQISVKDAWTYAERNVCAETDLITMGKLITEIMHMEYTEDFEIPVPLYALSNKYRYYGASSILNQRFLAIFGKEHNVDKVIVLPSSVHESATRFAA